MSITFVLQGKKERDDQCNPKCLLNLCGLSEFEVLVTRTIPKDFPEESVHYPHLILPFDWDLDETEFLMEWMSEVECTCPSCSRVALPKIPTVLTFTTENGFTRSTYEVEPEEVEVKYESWGGDSDDEGSDFYCRLDNARGLLDDLVGTFFSAKEFASSSLRYNRKKVL